VEIDRAPRQPATTAHHWTQQRAARQGLLSAGDDVADRPTVNLEAEDLLSARQDRLPGRKLEPTAAA
jgi:hypothetical protein